MPLSFLAILGLCSPARAHRLEADYRVLPGHKIAVESWFDLTGQSPVGARVSVYRQSGGAAVAEGNLDQKGLFVFSYSQSEPLRVVVSAGGGHRKELEIPAAALNVMDASATEKRSGTQALPSSQIANDVPAPFADRGTRISVKDVLLGVAFLLAVAAFGLALGNARKLRELRRKIRNQSDQKESGGCS